MLRILMMLPPLILALVVILVMRGVIPSPFGTGEVEKDAAFNRSFEREQVTAVYYETAQPVLVEPEISGYGRVVSAQTWQAVSQVSGRVSKLHDNLGVGSRLIAGTEVIVIDDTDYLISVRRTEANLASIRAELEELAMTEANLERSLEVEHEIGRLDLQELSRKRELVKRGSASQTQLDTANRSVISQQKRVLDLENNLALLPSKRKRLESSLIARRLDVEEARRALANTKITVPFDAWISTLNVQKDQFVKNGEILAVFKSLDSSEVIAEVTPGDLGHLLLTLTDGRAPQGEGATTQNELLALLRSQEIKVDVIQGARDQRFARAGEIIRLSGGIDQTTGTLGLVVRVGEPGEDNPQGKAPPLIDGTLVEVTFRTSPQEKQFVVPGQAIHYNDRGEAQLYTISEDNRLAVMPVEPGFQMAGRRIIRKGLKTGDRVIASNLPFVAEGMRLKPIPNFAGAL